MVIIMGDWMSVRKGTCIYVSDSGSPMVIIIIPYISVRIDIIKLIVIK